MNDSSTTRFADGTLLYVDSSALVKLVKRERESGDLEEYLRGSPLGSSAIARTEVLRAVSSGGPTAEARARQKLTAVNLVAVDVGVLEAAGKLLSISLRTLDAIHIASAATFGSQLREVVTYDKRMADGSRRAGFTVVAPGA